MSWLSKAAKGVKKTVKHEVKRATKTGFLDPLGLFQGAEKRNQRFRKAGRIGAGAAGGAIKGGLPGAFAGAGVAAYGASKKGQGNVPLTLGRALKDFGGGYLAGVGTNALASKFAASPALSSKLSLYQPGGALNASLGRSAVSNAVPASTSSPWSNILKASAVDTVKNTLFGSSQQPQQNVVEVPQQTAFDRVQAILDQYNKRKVRVYTPSTVAYNNSYGYD